MTGAVGGGHCRSSGKGKAPIDQEDVELCRYRIRCVGSYFRFGDRLKTDGAPEHVRHSLPRTGILYRQAREAPALFHKDGPSSRVAEGARQQQHGMLWCDDTEPGGDFGYRSCWSWSPEPWRRRCVDVSAIWHKSPSSLRCSSGNLACGGAGPEEAWKSRRFSCFRVVEPVFLEGQEASRLMTAGSATIPPDRDPFASFVSVRGVVTAKTAASVGSTP